MTRKRNVDVVATPWFIRLGLYILIGAIGLVLSFLGIVAPEQVDTWLGQVGNLAALVGGLLAAVNVTRDSKDSDDDEPQPAASTPSPVPAPAPAPSTGNQLLAQLRDRIAQNRG